MKVVKIDEPYKISLREMDVPAKKPGEAQIRIKRIGLCGTDLRSYRGQNPIVQYPIIFGHEIGGELMEEATISGMKYPAGTVVTVNPYTNCGTCPSCRRGRAYACQFNETLGNQRDGAAFEYMTIMTEKVYPLPGLSLDDAVCVEPLSVGFHASRRGEITSGDKVVVMGTGMIGLGAVIGAAARGAEVIAVDLDDDKLETARICGAAHVINTSKLELEAEVAKLTGGEGADVVIEAIGLPATYRAAIDIVAFTGRVVYIGYAKEDVPFTTKYFVAKELDIRGSRNAAPEDFSAVIETLKSGSVPVEKIITHRYPLQEADAAFKRWAENPGNVIKMILEA
ncbi:zinc-binding alcohol dehydrogenase family protein [Spirochaeta isovalerica]|uniref:2-desacetyl-2-hydroxyethyl bacteriochlorophyllide A dehydrogenase n=1 Tax=Spirochaeta isovalerica TaxID=150 RepID=A0A841RCV7_9SPIO|nr:zinc-binding alcohol dehydrogenase family protein [Spirochaeta isovalerica]MBB6480689.1 2-desacetyl-2-hydroxyethyl bacteriochlorophyllide A dehydrogenase [Spirochaeta isovalerica]